MWRLLLQRCAEEMAMEGCAEALLTFCLKMHKFYLPQRKMGFTVDRFQADCKLPVNAKCVVWRAPLIVLPLYSSDIGHIESFSFFLLFFIYHKHLWE